MKQNPTVEEILALIRRRAAEALLNQIIEDTKWN